MKQRKWLLIWVIVLVIAASAPLRVTAQTPAATMTVEAVYDGNFKYGEWLLLWADIENPGADTDAELSVRVSSSGSAVTYAMPVPLPSGARKRVPLYVLPNNFTRQLDVRLTSGDTLLASATVPARGQPNISYMVGLVTERRGALALLNALALPGQERPRVLVDILPDDLPERAEGLSSLDLLVFNNVDTSRLTPQQGDALQRWVEQGGRLVIGGGSGAQRTLAGLPEGLRPVTLGEPVELQSADLAELAAYGGDPNLPGSGAYLLSTVEAQNASVRVGSASLPLVVERGVQRGSVDFVALDLAAAPFEGWPGTLTFWNRLVEPGGEYPTNMPADMSERQMRSGSFYYALSNIPSLDLPSVRGLSILLLVYIILVGPVNYLLLRRFNKLHRAWVTIPAITLVFAAGAFGIGYAMRGTDLILNKVAVVETRSDGPATLETYIGLFSPRRQSYVIEVEGGGLLSAGSQDYAMSSGMGGVVGQEVRFTQGSPALVEGLSVTQWSMQAFVSESDWQDFGVLTGDLRLENGVLKGTVRNNTRQNLKDVTVVINRRYQKLGDLAVGQEASVDLGLADMNRDWSGSSLGYRIYMESYQFQGNPPRDASQKQNILDNVAENTSWSKNNPLMVSSAGGGLRQAFLFGWSDQVPPDVSVRGSRITQMATALVYSSAPIQVDTTRRVEVPPGLIQGRLSQVDRGFGSCGMGASASVWLDNATASFEFNLPAVLLQAGVDKLMLSMWRDNTMSNLEELAIYDWKQQGWAIIPQNSGANLFTIQNGANYVSENGLVQVRVSVPANNGTCLYFDLGVETRGAAQGG